MRSEFESYFRKTLFYSNMLFSAAENGIAISPFEMVRGQYRNTYVQLAYSVYSHQQSKVDELQKRVDELELAIKGAVTFVDLQIEATEQGREAAIGIKEKNWWSSKLLMLRPVRRVLEQALKGGSNE